MNQHVIIVNSYGEFIAFHDDFKFATQKYTNDLVYYLTDEIFAYLFNRQTNSYVILVDKVINNIIDLKSYIKIREVIPYTVSKTTTIANLISNIKLTCSNYINNGMSVQLFSNESRNFSFKIEDQINLKELVDFKKSGDIIYYHDSENYTDILYSYEDIVTIYKTLYNNKLYNLIYCNILCDWIKNNDISENPVFYGYSNDEITTKLEERYNAQLLQ